LHEIQISEGILQASILGHTLWPRVSAGATPFKGNGAASLRKPLRGAGRRRLTCLVA